MPNTKRYTILLAEELALVREGIARLCEANGCFRVAGHCSDGVAAHGAAADRSARCCGHRLQSTEAFQPGARQANQGERRATRFLIMAAKGDRKMALEALRSGANGFVLKSANGDHLLEALHQVAVGSIYVSSELQFERIFMTPRRSEPEDPLETLSSREYQVFQLMIEGIRAKEIACRLNLSPKTVDTYRASLMRKLDIHDVPGSGQVRDTAGLNVSSLSAVLLVRW